VTTLSWNKEPICCLRPHFYYCQRVAGLLIRGALSDERTSLSFTICWSSPAQSFLGPSPLGLATILYCLRFETSFSLPSTTRRVMVEVFYPASTRDLSNPKFKVTLRLAVYRQSVCLGVKPLETHDQNFLPPNWTFAILVLTYHPLWREDGFVRYEYAWPFVKCTFRIYSMLL
jgi:hypothetical protein